MEPVAHALGNAALADLRSAWHGPCAMVVASDDDNTSTSPQLQLRGDVCCVGHVRLDNRGQLRRELGGEYDTNDDDTVLVAAAYARWGEELTGHLLGDFSFIVWDTQHQRLFAACDHLGVRSLYYRRLDGCLILSNSIRPLVSYPFPTPAADRTAVACLQRDGEHYMPDTCLLEGVYALPGGHSLLLGEGRLSCKQYWRVGIGEERFPGTVDDAVSELQSLLRQSVQARLREGNRPGAHLSGGLDSSLLVALSAPASQAQLQCFSWMRAPTSEEQRADPEWATAEELARSYALPLTYTEYSAGDLREIFTHHDMALGDSVDLWSEHGLRRNAAAAGVDTLISGWGGDQFISNFGNNIYAQRLLEGEFAGVLAELACRKGGALHGPKKLLVNLRDFLAAPLLRSCLPARMPGTLEFASEEQRELARSEPTVEVYSGVKLGEEMGSEAVLLHLQNRLRSWYSAGQDSGINYSYPLLDKRLVEFALSLPATFFRWRGEGRHLMRAAAAELPPQRLWRLNQKREPRRTQHNVRCELEAMRRWQREHVNDETPSTFVDKTKLGNAIVRETAEHALSSPRAQRRFRGMLRSILVLQLERRYSPGER